MKKVFVFFLLAILFIGQYVACLILEKKIVKVDLARKNGMIQVRIKDGVGLLTAERIKNLRVDEYFLLKKIEEKKFLHQVSSNSIKKIYTTDPFRRLANREDVVSNMDINRKDVVSAIGEKFDGNFYDIKNTSGSFGVWNDILVKALYCDISGYDKDDFFILNLMHKQNGGYFDTHYLLALLLLKENKCWEEEVINAQVKIVSEYIIEAQENDYVFSDLYAERIVFLYWAGYQSSIKKEWIDLIIQNYNPAYGWMDPQKQEFSLHVTGLSLLSLIYYAEGNNKQTIY
jgi:hypothetical protein